MARWIRDGKIIDRDFSYILGALVAGGLTVGYHMKIKTKSGGTFSYPSRFLSMTNTDESYIGLVAKIIRRNTTLNVKPAEHEYKTEANGRHYENKRINFFSHIPAKEMDFFAKLITLSWKNNKPNHARKLKRRPKRQKDFRKLRELMLNSERKMQKYFLQAILDARATPYYDRRHLPNLTFRFRAKEDQYLIIDSVLTDYGIAHNYNDSYFYITRPYDVMKTLKIGFNSTPLNIKIASLVGEMKRGRKPLGKREPGIERLIKYLYSKFT